MTAYDDNNKTNVIWCWASIKNHNKKLISEMEYTLHIPRTESWLYYHFINIRHRGIRCARLDRALASASLAYGSQ